MLRFSVCTGAAIALLTLTSGASPAMVQMAMAPDFSRNDLSGHPVHLIDYRGKVVLLNFWASWCGPCREEMPQFSQWQHRYGPKGLRVIGVAMDDDAASAKTFLKQFPVSYPIVMGDAKLGESFGGILGLPTSYLVDAEGRLVARYRGESDLKKIEEQIQTLLVRRSH